MAQAKGAAMLQMYASSTYRAHSITDTDSTEQNQFNSPLLRLPGELRNTIYEYALDGRVWRVCGDNECLVHGSTQTRLLEAIEVADACSLLRTCRQIHAEAQDLPQSLITFSSCDATNLKSWFENDGSRMAFKATRLSLAQDSYGLWWNSRVSWYLCEEWQKGLTWKDLPCLKHLEIAVDLSGEGQWELEECDILDGGKCLDFQFARMYEEFEKCKAHVEALNPGVTCTVNAENFGQELFTDWLSRTGKRPIV
jgi:hypothetical protein